MVGYAATASWIYDRGMAIGQLRPMLASLADDLPTGPGWLYEPKWDGFLHWTLSRRCVRGVVLLGWNILHGRAPIQVRTREIE